MITTYKHKSVTKIYAPNSETLLKYREETSIKKTIPQRVKVKCLRQGQDQNRASMFLVPSISGDPGNDFHGLESYLSLNLDDDTAVTRSVYAFQADDSGNVNNDESQDIAKIAHGYCLYILRNWRNKGPVLIGGWSVGGIIAYEMVHQLRNYRIKASAILIDTQAPNQVRNMTLEQHAMYLMHLIAELPVSLSSFCWLNDNLNEPRTLSEEGKSIYDKLLILDSKQAQISTLNNFLKSKLISTQEKELNQLNMVFSHIAAIHDYKEERPMKNAWLIVSSKNKAQHGDSLGWQIPNRRRFLHVLKSDHFSIMRGGLWEIQMLTDELEEIIDEFELVETVDRTKSLGGVRPKVSDHFTGRDEQIDGLKTFLDEHNTGVIAEQGITGIGGVGKTQLATRFVEIAIAEDRYDLIGWFNVPLEKLSMNMEAISMSGVADDVSDDNEDPIYNDFRRLAVSLHVRMTRDKKQNITSIKECLKKIPRVLLVFDNALDIRDIRDYIYEPEEGQLCHCVVTSRNQTWEDFRTIRLSPFNEQEAFDFLTRGLKDQKSFERLSQKEKNKNIKTLAIRLHFFPLALNQAVCYIWAESDMSIEVYLQNYDKKKRSAT